MDKMGMEEIIRNQMKELREKKAQFLNEAHKCDVQLEVLDRLMEDVKKKDEEIRKETIAKEITKDKAPGFLIDREDKKRINIFLEFMEKCEDELTYAKARAKMPRIESALYRHPKLWQGWRDFKDDYHRWLNREGKWQGILEKPENGNQQ